MRILLTVAIADMNLGSIGSMKELGITESYKLKRQVVISASEAAEMIIRYVVVFLIAAFDANHLAQTAWTTFCERHRGNAKLYRLDIDCIFVLCANPLTLCIVHKASLTNLLVAQFRFECPAACQTYDRGRAAFSIENSAAK